MQEKIQLIRIDANVQWNVIRAKGGNWVGTCEPLRLTVQSETWSELMEDIGITLDAVLRDLLASNELPQFLQERGWRILAGQIPRAQDSVRFDVPFLPTMMGQHDPTRELHQ